MKYTKDDLETQVALLSVLARGCKNHRSYRAIRPPRSTAVRPAGIHLICGMCAFIYSAAEDLRRVEVEV